MGLAGIEAAMNSIPAKKEELQKSFEELLTCSPPFASFPFQWKDIDEHISSIEKSIGHRLHELKSLDTRSEPENPAAPLPAVISKEDQCKPGVVPRANLKSLCINMDAKALRSYIITNQNDCVAIRQELGPALLFAPDPVALVLDSFQGFAPIEQTSEGDAHTIRKACYTLLESIHELALDIKPVEKERARQLAVECNGLISSWKMENVVTASLILQLIVTFGLDGFFQFDAVLDLLVMAAARKKSLDLCRNSIPKEKVPDLIEKLNSMGRQIDSIKFVIAFDLIAKYPPAHLFDAYIKDSRRWVEQHNTPNFEREAYQRERFILKTVIKAVEEYRLQHYYRTRGLRRRVKVLEELLNRRASKLKEPHSSSRAKMWQQRGRSGRKLLRSSNFAKNLGAARSESRNPPQLGFVDFGNSCGFGVPPAFYNCGGGLMGHGPGPGGLIGHGPVATPGFPAGL